LQRVALALAGQRGTGGGQGGDRKPGPAWDGKV
jgi:hypothetical protein